MSYRSAHINFVNFTGTAGTWRAQAIEDAGGWKSVSLVEDCELSFRALFAGYSTKFVKEVVQPAELPASYTAYKAQQKRWTQGWGQLIQEHFWHLASGGYETPLPRRLFLLYHMTVVCQWPVWGAWMLITPFMLYFGFWLPYPFMVYTFPMLSWVLYMLCVSTCQTEYTYASNGCLHVMLRSLRIFPYLFINCGMLPHQLCSFVQGLYSKESEFERTAKTGNILQTHDTVLAQKTPLAQPQASTAYKANINCTYACVELLFTLYMIGWTIAFGIEAQWVPFIMSCGIGVCVAFLLVMYGDDRPEHPLNMLFECSNNAEFEAAVPEHSCMDEETPLLIADARPHVEPTTKDHHMDEDRKGSHGSLSAPNEVSDDSEYEVKKPHDY